MAVRSLVRFALLAAASAFAVPASASAILINQQKALAGNITPGDTAGFPVTLSVAGLYQFDSDLIVPAGKAGIAISQGYVTLDLNGYTLSGRGTATQGIAGNRPNVTIENGTITGFSSDGIAGTLDYWIITGMRVVGNGRDGVRIGDNGRIINSTISHNVRYGVSCNNACHVEGNVVSYNGGTGIYIGTGTALGNTVVKNTSYGLYMYYGAFGNNTLILNNNDQSGPQVLGAAYALHPNFCNPADLPLSISST